MLYKRTCVLGVERMIDGGPDECIPCYNKNIPLCVSISFTVAVCLRCNKVDGRGVAQR